jgi:hypothetical protein
LSLKIHPIKEFFRQLIVAEIVKSFAFPKIFSDGVKIAVVSVFSGRLENRESTP